MRYDQLTQDEMDDEVAEALYHREKEHFNYALNIALFQEQLKLLAPALRDTMMPSHKGAMPETYGQHITRLISEHERELAKVEAVHAALSVQLPDGPRKSASLARTAAKRAEAETKPTPK